MLQTEARHTYKWPREREWQAERERGAERCAREVDAIESVVSRASCARGGLLIYLRDRSRMRECERCVAILIHGHTHRPAIHELCINNSPAKRIVLGAWHDKGTYLQIDQDNNAVLLDIP